MSAASSRFDVFEPEKSFDEKTRKLGDSQISEDHSEASTLELPHKINARGGGPLGPAPADDVPEFSPEFYSRDSVNSGILPYKVVSTPEEAAAASAFFESFKTGESDGQKQRANKKHGRVFSLTQFLINVKTGERMYSQEQLDAGLADLRDRELLEHHAYIWQSKDRYNEKGAAARREKGYGNVQPGDLVPVHVHVAILLNPGCDLTVRQVSDVFEMPSSRVKVASDALGDDAPTGRGAAKKAFLDLVQYMTHERVWGDHSEPDGIPAWERGAR